jgi:hypothetical protein
LNSVIRTIGIVALGLFALTAAPGKTSAQVPTADAENMVNCPELLHAEPLTPYGFAKATLVSLWYARNAAQRSVEIKKAAKESTNELSFMTAMMRIAKTSTNDFICAKRAVRPFTVDESGENAKTSSQFFEVVYDDHIGINQRLLDLFQKMDHYSQAQVADEISTLQVERDQRWADLVQPTTLALASLIDDSNKDPNSKSDRLVITKAQKQSLFAWANEHFPEFKNGAPEKDWSDPAKTAHMYFPFLNGRKGSDE